MGLGEPTGAAPATRAEGGPPASACPTGFLVRFHAVNAMGLARLAEASVTVPGSREAACR
jgi:hypothetical protein